MPELAGVARYFVAHSATEAAAGQSHITHSRSPMRFSGAHHSARMGEARRLFEPAGSRVRAGRGARTIGAQIRHRGVTSDGVAGEGSSWLCAATGRYRIDNPALDILRWRLMTARIQPTSSMRASTHRAVRRATVRPGLHAASSRRHQSRRQRIACRRYRSHRQDGSA